MSKAIQGTRWSRVVFLTGLFCARLYSSPKRRHYDIAKYTSTYIYDCWDCCVSSTSIEPAPRLIFCSSGTFLVPYVYLFSFRLSPCAHLQNLWMQSLLWGPIAFSCRKRDAQARFFLCVHYGLAIVSNSIPAVTKSTFMCITDLILALLCVELLCSPKCYYSLINACTAINGLT